MAGQWLAVLPHSEKVLGSTLSSAFSPGIVAFWLPPTDCFSVNLSVPHLLPSDSWYDLKLPMKQTEHGWMNSVTRRRVKMAASKDLALSRFNSVTRKEVGEQAADACICPIRDNVA